MRHIWLISVCLLISFISANCDSAGQRKLLNTGDEHDDGIARNSKLPICDTPGCKCNHRDAQQATEVTCDCADSDSNVKLIKFSSIRSTQLKVIRLLRCENVDLVSKDIYQLSLTELTLQTITALMIKENVLKRVANLTIVDVTMFSFENGAFEDLDADNVLLKNVQFNEGSHVDVFNPLRITSKLQFRNLTLPEDVPIVVNKVGGVSNLTVGFYDCKLHAADIKIKGVDNFEMKRNTFIGFDEKKEERINVQFNQNVLMSDNRFQDQNMPLISINSTGQSTMDIGFNGVGKKSNFTSIVKSWMSIFVLRSANPDNSDRARECKEAPIAKRYIISCPNAKSILKYTETHNFKRIFESATVNNSNSGCNFINTPSAFQLTLLLVFILGKIH